MKCEWESRVFDDCIEKVTYTQKVQRKDFLDDGEFPIVSQEEAFINGYWNDDVDLYRVSTPVIIFGDHTKVLKYVDFNFVLGADGVKILKPRPFLFPKFFYYRLTAENFESLGYARHYKLLKGLEIPVPPLPEQKRIVAILDQAFDAIATAKAIAEKNLQNARALFDSHLQAVFSQRGGGWVETTLGDVCQFENGDRGKNYPHRSEYVASGIPWINTGHIEQDGTLSQSEMNYISRKKFDSLRSGKIQPGDLVYCLRGATLGKTALVDPLIEGAVASSLVIIRPNSSIDGRFLYLFLTSPLGQSHIKGYENGAAQPNLGAKSVAKYPISLPAISEQKKIVVELDSIATNSQRLRSIYQRKLAALDDLKKSLLQQAFAGEL